MSTFRAVRQVFRDLLRLDGRLSENVIRSQGGKSEPNHCRVNTIKSVVQSFSRPAVQAFSRFFVARNIVRLSSASALRRQTVLRLISQNGSSTPIFAFLGFAYVGISHDLENEEQVKPSLSKLFSYIQNDFQQKRDERHYSDLATVCLGNKLNDFDIQERLGKPSACAAVYAAECKASKEPVAIKIMYNYEHASNTMALKQGFEREFKVLTPPDTRQDYIEGDENPLSLSSHPNIIPVRHVFTDDMPCLYDSKVSYPAALPLRHDGNGLGRNRTLCLVMPKYDCTLGEYLSEYRGQLSIKESVMLFAQLLEGITHLVAHSVAHRDLKTDNILLNTHATGCPKLVITDFGCCLAEREWGLQLPFQTNYVNRGGNSALMAPEIACAIPGPGNILDYSKADMWAAASIAFEIFGSLNPFSGGNLSNRTYSDEDLPLLDSCPLGMIENMLHIMLRRDPVERPSCSEAATLVQLLLFAPASWFLESKIETLSDQEVYRWLMKLCIRSLQDECRDICREHDEISAETEILRSFVSRTSVDEVLSALRYLHG